MAVGWGGRGADGMFWKEGEQDTLSANDLLDCKVQQAPSAAMSVSVWTSDERRENPYKNRDTAQLL
jgi:hypothetical protein